MNDRTLTDYNNMLAAGADRFAPPMPWEEQEGGYHEEGYLDRLFSGAFALPFARVITQRGAHGSICGCCGQPITGGRVIVDSGQGRAPGICCERCLVPTVWESYAPGITEHAVCTECGGMIIDGEDCFAWRGPEKYGGYVCTDCACEGAW